MRQRRSLDFSRTGHRLVVQSPGGLHVVEVSGVAAPIRIDLPQLHDFAVVDDEVWTVSGKPAALQRFRFNGEPVGAPRPLDGAPDNATLSTAAFGPRFAVWTGEPAVSLVGGADGIDVVPIPGESDHVVPIGPTRWLTYRHGALRLRDSASDRWAVGAPVKEGRVVSGAALFDGRSAVVEVLAPGANGTSTPTHLVVVSLRDGAIQHRMSVPGLTMVRIAAQRGYALVLTGRRLFLVDLRFGRVVADHESEQDLLDLAIDSSAQQLAIRLGEGEDGVVCRPVREVLQAAARTSLVVDRELRPPAPPPEIEEAEAPPASAAIEAVAFHTGHAALGALPGLGLRPTVATVTRAENDELLRRYHTLISSMVGRAIAEAWDKGRLTFPNEGTHPFLNEVTGLLGRTRGKAAIELSTASQDVSEATRRIHAAEKACAPRVAPLTALSNEFGVSALGRTILLLVAGPTLWGDLARLYGILANDEGREFVDEYLLTQILSPAVDPQVIARELDRDQPLIRYGMIHSNGKRMRPFSGLSADPIVLKLLRNAPIETELDDDIRVVAQTRSFEELLIPAKVKDAMLRDLAQASGHPEGMRIVVRGRTGAGRHTLLATLAAAANRRLAVIDMSPLARDSKLLVERLRGALRRAHLVGLLPCVDGIDTLASDDQIGKEGVREVLRNHAGPVAVRVPRDTQLALDPGFASIELPTLAIGERLTCWNASMAAHGLRAREPLVLATRYAVGPGVIERVCATIDPGDAAPGQDHDQRLDTEVRKHLESRLGAIANRVTRLTSWAQVVLPPEIQESLLELIARISHRGLVFDTWGFSATMSTTRGVTALFQGGPGTGKTLVAGAIANELGMDLYRVDLSRVMSKWIGETEQNLAKLFDAAEDGHAIILFDEADSLFAKRTEVRTSVDRYANLEVNYLLQRLDSFEGIAILTTNFGTGIDSAFRRRLSFRLTFPFPDEEMREQLWKAHLPPAAPTSGDFDMAELARRYRLSGGYIRNAALRAAFLAAEERTPITQDHLERAIKAEFREIGKLADSGVLE